MVVKTTNLPGYANSSFILKKSLVFLKNMAKQRIVNTRIWNDTWVSHLDPTEKLLFLYFLTNEHTNISGIYELPLKVAAVETGIDPTMFSKILPRLSPKVFYHEGWVILPNFPKYQNSENPKVQVGIKNEIMALPSEIKEKAIAYGYPIGSLSHPNSNPNSLNAGYRVEREPTKEKKVTPAIQAVFDLFQGNPARLVWKTRLYQREAAKVLSDTYGIDELKRRYQVSLKYKDEQHCPQIDSPSDFLDKMPKMENFLKKL